MERHTHSFVIILKHSLGVKSSNVTVIWRVWITCFHYKTKLAWVDTCEYKSHMFHHILAMQEKEAMTFIFSFWQLPPKNIIVFGDARNLNNSFSNQRAALIVFVNIPAAGPPDTKLNQGIKLKSKMKVIKTTVYSWILVSPARGGTFPRVWVGSK